MDYSGVVRDCFARAHPCMFAAGAKARGLETGLPGDPSVHSFVLTNSAHVMFYVHCATVYVPMDAQTSAGLVSANQVIVQFAYSRSYTHRGNRAHRPLPPARPSRQPHTKPQPTNRRTDSRPCPVARTIQKPSVISHTHTHTHTLHLSGRSQPMRLQALGCWNLCRWS